jgi:hypothetical protein
MSAKEATTKQANEVRIGIPLKAYVRFSHHIDEQLGRLEDRIRAAVPQLARRGLLKERRSDRL